MRIALKKGSKIYLNGAVVRVDRKVSIEILNDVKFLLDCNVMQLNEANTPLKQLYFVIQALLINPSDAQTLRQSVSVMILALCAYFEIDSTRDALEEVHKYTIEERYYEALKCLRLLFSNEERSESFSQKELPR